jgi:hypothetical protein
MAPATSAISPLSREFLTLSMTRTWWKKHKPEQIVAKLRDALASERRE